MDTAVACRRVTKLMGNRFEFTVVVSDKDFGETAIDAAIAEVKRIEELLSTYKDTSETNQVNAAAGISPVKVSEEFLALVNRAIRLGDLTDGAFDITYGSIDKSLWNFDVNMEALPDPIIAKKSVSLISYKNVLINEAVGTIFLKNKGMRIGFGGIGKGYAADKAKYLLQQMGIKSGIVNAAGDLTTWGTQINGTPWTIGIADPDQTSRPFSSLNISNMAIATSGNYEKFILIDGVRYSHTIDPKTGLPVTGIKSVSIICPSAELADALATPVTVMGIKVGLNLINQLTNVACLIVTDHDKIYTSKNINIIN